MWFQLRFIKSARCNHSKPLAVIGLALDGPTQPNAITTKNVLVILDILVRLLEQQQSLVGAGNFPYRLRSFME